MFFQSKEGPIYYEVFGPSDAPAVVFTHGGGLNGEMFSKQVDALRKNYRVVTWDVQGHGRSAPLKESLDVPYMAQCLVGIMDEAGIDTAVLVGQSLGVYINQHAAISYPDRIKALVSIGGLPVDKPMSRVELAVFRALLAVSKLLPAKVIFTRAAGEKTTTPEAKQFFLNSMNRMGKTQFLRMLAGQLNACDIKVDTPPRQPLLITHGEHEMPKSLIKGNREWHASVPGSRYHEVPGAGHNANQDRPDVFNQVLLDFLSEVA